MRISDWSSDVCSSDLSFSPLPPPAEGESRGYDSTLGTHQSRSNQPWRIQNTKLTVRVNTLTPLIQMRQSRLATNLAECQMRNEWTAKTGRASCREREWQYV